MTVTDATETSLSGSKDDVLRVLRSIEDPDLGMDIVTLLAYSVPVYWYTGNPNFG